MKSSCPVFTRVKAMKLVILLARIICQASQPVKGQRIENRVTRTQLLRLDETSKVAIWNGSRYVFASVNDANKFISYSKHT